MAEVDKLEIAGLVLVNVPVKIHPDSTYPFVEIGEVRRQGVVGLPILFALGRFRWNARTNAFSTLEPSKPSKKSRENLAFDEFLLINRAGFRGEPLNLLLDSGSEYTYMFPSFQIPDDLKASGRPLAYQMHAADVGSVDVPALSVPSLPLTIGGANIVLAPGNILLKGARPNNRMFDGNLGMDVLSEADAFELDFSAMALSLTVNKQPKHSSVTTEHSQTNRHPPA